MFDGDVILTVGGALSPVPIPILGVLAGRASTLHVNSWVAAAPAVFAATADTFHAPAVEGVPAMTPVAGAIESPGGRPEAPYVIARPAGSVALSRNATFCPIVLVWLPGFVNNGALADHVTSADSGLRVPDVE